MQQKPSQLSAASTHEAAEYCPEGLFAVLTPQANTTAEMELSVLAPRGCGLATARLVSGKSRMSARLVDYVAQQSATLDRFANAPVSAAIFACTGAAYLVDPVEEARQTNAIETVRGYPFVTAASAVADALAALGAKRVGLISPYDDDLHTAALEYWAKRGLQPVVIGRIVGKSESFHPIYATPASKAEQAMDALPDADRDCILFLGTGLPTLPIIATRSNEAIPILSPNICLMWRAVLAATGTLPTQENLLRWVTGKPHWLGRFQEWIAT
jgi:maleate isomerase